MDGSCSSPLASPSVAVPSRPARSARSSPRPATLESAERRDARRGGGPEDKALYSCALRLRLQGVRDHLGGLPALRYRAGLVAARYTRAGEGNRTPISGLGSQRLSHWTTPARRRRGYRLAQGYPWTGCAPASTGPSPIAAALLSGCWPTASPTTGADTTLDAATAKGERVDAADARHAARARRRGHGLARRLQGQGRAGQRVGVLVRALPRRAAADRAGAQDALARAGRDRARDRRQGELRRRVEGGRGVRAARYPNLRDRDGSYVREWGQTGYPENYVIDRQGRVAAVRRFPVTQEWLDETLPPLLEEAA